MTTDDLVKALFAELGWEEGDDIEIKIAGGRTCGVLQTEGSNPKWSPPYGTVTYNNDAQIVIENLSRRDFSKSKPVDEVELLSKFHYGSDGQLYKTRESQELPEPSPMADTRSHPWLEIIKRIRTTLSK